ncbi:MAG: flagellar protein [Lachnospiraceae bacterium]|nr:flagellar protein [Lachnospiraceae bacterium]
MNVRNCRKCGRIFNYISGPAICPKCKEDQEELFQNVKAYIQDHRSAGIQEVSRECEVEIQQIQQWIREERLEFAEGSTIGIACEKCGAMIRSGRFCDKCKAEMINGLNSAIKKPEEPKPQKDPKDSPRMRFL